MALSAGLVALYAIQIGAGKGNMKAVSSASKGVMLCQAGALSMTKSGGAGA